MVASHNEDTVKFTLEKYVLHKDGRTCDVYKVLILPQLNHILCQLPKEIIGFIEYYIILYCHTSGSYYVTAL